MFPLSRSGTARASSSISQISNGLRPARTRGGGGEISPPSAPSLYAFLLHPRSLRLLGAVLAAVCVWALIAQGPWAQERERPQRTSWGDPDIRGIWDFKTLTPLQRPEELADKTFLTDEEAAEFERKELANHDADRRDGPAIRDINRGYNQFWHDRGTNITSDRRTSLIVDPPDGRIPALTAAAQVEMGLPRRRPVTERIVIGSLLLGPEDVGLSERCILGFSSGPPIVPSGNNNNLQLFQTPNYVVVFTEMIHEARIIPLDGRPPLPSGIRQWLGDSRGRWEGEALVVETSNFTEKVSFSGGLTGRGGGGETFHLVERFMRVDADTLLYEFTVEDRSWWTRPWTVTVPMTKTTWPLFEYACHEGNYGMAGMLRGARADDGAPDVTGLVR